MPELGTFEDERDGCVYKTVKIGNQVWFAENFRFDCAGSMVYENKTKNLKRYGRLYTWYSAMNAAPKGWRLPSKEDWNELIRFADVEEAGIKVLKSKAHWQWNKGTDELGFGALPGGDCLPGGGFTRAIGYGGYWWSAGEYDKKFAYAFGIYHDVESTYCYSLDKSYLFSVRLLLDEQLPNRQFGL